jgi:hypothetical protein
LDDGDITGVIVVTTVSSDPLYGTVVDTVDFTNSDNDVSGVTVQNNVGISILEAVPGDVGTVSLDLDAEPTAGVTLTFSSDISESTLSVASLTFNSANWDTAQTLTVTVADDNVDDGDIVYNITTLTTSSDTNYAGAPVSAITVTTVDGKKLCVCAFVCVCVCVCVCFCLLLCFLNCGFDLATFYFVR